jgi:hypothetical protein
MLLAAAMVAAFVIPTAPAAAFCDESEGCSPCPPPHVVVDREHGVQVIWYYC